MRKKILYIAQYGIGNRISGLLTAMRCADILDAILYIYWDIDQHCMASLADIFDEIPFNIINSNEYQNLPKMQEFGDLNPLTKDLPDTFIIKATTFRYFDDDINPESIDFSIYFKQLTLVKPIANLIKKLSEKYQFEKMLGVHIRKTDKGHWLSETTDRGYLSAEKIMFNIDRRYLAAIKTILDKKPGTKIFLATDDREEEQAIVSILKPPKGTILALPKPRYNAISLYPVGRDLRGVQEAMVDMMLLSKCQCILYGLGTFGHCAARISNTKRVNIISEQSVLFIEEIKKIRPIQEIIKDIEFSLLDNHGESPSTPLASESE